MKLRVFIIAAVALVAGISLVLLLRSGHTDLHDSFDPDVLESLSPAKEAVVLRDWLDNSEWAFDERVRMLKWLFQERPEAVMEAIRQNPFAVGSLPEELSRACLELIREKDAEAATGILRTGAQVYPNDPHMLGMAGVAAYLSGRVQEAYRLLNQSELWQREIPLVDFYLGGILVQSEIAADKARGKALLTRVAKAGDADFSTLAALLVLTDLTVPLIEAEFRELFDLLKGVNVFQSGNPDLNSDGLRNLIRRSTRFYPEETLGLAELLLEYPGSTDADRLVYVQLAQSMGLPEKAATMLQDLADSPDFAEGSVEEMLLPRVMAVQKVLSGEYEEGLESLNEIAAANPDDPTIKDLYLLALEAEVPISVEKELLELLLQAKEVPPPLSLRALNRLLEIDPLREETWKTHAIEHLLLENPSLVGNWLIRNAASDQVIDYLQAREDQLDSDGYSILVEASLEKGRTETARNVLARTSGTIEPAVHAFLSARTFLQEGNNDQAYEKWREAYNAALGTDAFPMIKNLGFLALDLGQPITALQSLYSAYSSGIPFSQREASTLMELTLRHGNLAQSISIAQYLVNTFPGNPRHINNLAYFKFIAEEDLDTQVDLMRELAEQYPDVTNYQLTLALGLYKLGRVNEASRLIQNTSINWGEADNRAQLIYAVILSANDQRVVAEGLIRNMDTESLVPEEKALLETM
jgi:hypothetical protein